MLPILSAYAAVFVSAVYCAYEHHRQAQARREIEKRVRLAALLWAVANHDER